MYSAMAMRYMVHAATSQRILAGVSAALSWLRIFDVSTIIKPEKSNVGSMYRSKERSNHSAEVGKVDRRPLGLSHHTSTGYMIPLLPSRIRFTAMSHANRTPCHPLRRVSTFTRGCDWFMPVTVRLACCKSAWVYVGKKWGRHTGMLACSV